MTKVLAPILLRSVSDLGLTGRVRCGLQSTTSKPTVSSSAPLALLWDSCLGPHLDIGWCKEHIFYKSSAAFVPCHKCNHLQNVLAPISFRRFLVADDR
eukprot:3497466-Rhodomonas_salina.2